MDIYAVLRARFEQVQYDKKSIIGNIIHNSTVLVYTLVPGTAKKWQWQNDKCRRLSAKYRRVCHCR